MKSPKKSKPGLLFKPSIKRQAANIALAILTLKKRKRINANSRLLAK